MAADFVDSIDVLNLAVRRVYSLYRLIAHSADRFRHAPIDCVVPIKRQHFSTGRIENHFAEWNAAQLLVFIQQSRNQLIHWPLRRERRLGQSGARERCRSDPRNESHLPGFKMDAPILSKTKHPVTAILVDGRRASCLAGNS